MEMERLLELLYPLQPLRRGNGATDSDIRAAAEELRVTFPRSYCEFLRQFGWIQTPLITVFGVGSDVPEHLALVRVAKAEWADSQPRLPSRLVPIVNDGSGNLYCLDIAQMRNFECPVVFWDHEAEAGSLQEPERAGNDFYSWIVDEIMNLASE